jgi:hypothetical protein
MKKRDDEKKEQQTFFDGYVCSNCYYETYNIVLHSIPNGTPHENFLRGEF